MKIHLRQIPVEGKRLEGEEDCAIPDLSTEEIRCVAPLRYALDVGISGDALWAKGELQQDVELRCVSCLEPFVHTIHVRDFAAHIESSGPELVDLAPAMREDILLNLPAHPHCDQHGGRTCRAALPPEADRREADEAASKRERDWGALNDLKLGNG